MFRLTQSNPSNFCREVFSTYRNHRLNMNRVCLTQSKSFNLLQGGFFNLHKSHVEYEHQGFDSLSWNHSSCWQGCVLNLHKSHVEYAWTPGFKSLSRNHSSCWQGCVFNLQRSQVEYEQGWTRSVETIQHLAGMCFQPTEIIGWIWTGLDSLSRNHSTFGRDVFSTYRDHRLNMNRVWLTQSKPFNINFGKGVVLNRLC